MNGPTFTPIPSRLLPDMTMQDGVSVLCQGNPGALMTMAQAMNANAALGAQFLSDIDQAGLSGEQVYLLGKHAGSPARAAVLLHLSLNADMPPLSELVANLNKPLSPDFERAAFLLAPLVIPSLAGLDLSLPEVRHG